MSEEFCLDTIFTNQQMEGIAVLVEIHLCEEGPVGEVARMLYERLKNESLFKSFEAFGDMSEYAQKGKLLRRA